MTLKFADYFSKLAPIYVKHRPSYPEELLKAVVEPCKNRSLAWDAGTGSGQAAVRLGEYFGRVIGTDASAAQIANALQHPRVEYGVEAAEGSKINDFSLDLVTAAQAAHWFRIDEFYAEIRRVLKPGGVVALWCYGLESVTDDVNLVIEKLNVELLGRYWPKRTLVDHTYQDIPFPFEELPRRVFRMHMVWTLDDLLNGFRTWSASLRYKQDNGVDPVDILLDEFKEAWDRPEEPRIVSWPIYLRQGRST